MNDSDNGLEKINNNEVINLDDDNEGNQIHNTFYSVNFQKINNDSNFGKTSYHFFSKKGRNIRSRSLNSSDNKNNNN